MYLDIYKNIYISTIMEGYIYVMIHETDFRKNSNHWNKVSPCSVNTIL